MSAINNMDSLSENQPSPLPLPHLLLASQSESRRKLLLAAAVPFKTVHTDFSEESMKTHYRSQYMTAQKLAAALAQGKAGGVSPQEAETFILGCDQVLEMANGQQLDKAHDKTEAAHILRSLSGETHYLHSAAVIMNKDEKIWEHVQTVRLTMRPLSDSFIERYLDREWEQVRWCVGCYQIESMGAQLFQSIEGCQFAIQGLPLLPLLDFLRDQGVLMK